MLSQFKEMLSARLNFIDKNSYIFKTLYFGFKYQQHKKICEFFKFLRIKSLFHI